MNLRDLYHYVKPWAKGAPNVMIDAELVAAGVELALHAQNLRRTITLDAQAGWGDYVFDLDESEVLIMVKSVCVGAERLSPLGDAPCIGNVIGYDQCAPCGGEPAHGYRVPCPGRLLIYPAPCMDMPEGISIEVSVQPSRATCTLPDDYYERWGRVIADGALSRLLTMPKTDWTNIALSQRFGVAFKEGKAAARAFSGAQYQPSDARIQYNVQRLLTE
jgi:hypothetical protein